LQDASRTHSAYGVMAGDKSNGAVEEVWQASIADDKGEALSSAELTARITSKLERLREQFQEQEEERTKLLNGTKICTELQPGDAKKLLQELEGRTEIVCQEERAMKALLAELAADLADLRQHAADSTAADEACHDALAETELERQALREALKEAEDREILASQRSRSMVTADSVERSLAEAKAVRQQLGEQEEETRKLREALLNSWGDRSEDDQEGHGNLSSLTDLEGLEEALTWLSDMQKSAAEEVHKVQHLERSEAALQAKIAAACEEKAMLQSAHVDLANQGLAMREAVQAQSDRFVQRVVVWLPQGKAPTLLELGCFRR